MYKVQGVVPCYYTVTVLIRVYRMWCASSVVVESYDYMVRTAPLLTTTIGVVESYDYIIYRCVVKEENSKRFSQYYSIAQLVKF